MVQIVNGGVIADRKRTGVLFFLRGGVSNRIDQRYESRV